MTLHRIEIMQPLLDQIAIALEHSRLYSATQHEIAERKQAEEKLRESESRLRAITMGLPDLVFVIDEDGRYIEILTAEENLLYDTAEHLKGHLLHDVLPKESADLFLETVRQTVQTGTNQVLEYQLDVLAGERWFEGHTSFLGEVSGQKKAVVWISRDITERRRMEQELIRLERMRARSEMVQGVNHNLNNLLNGVLLPAQLLKDNLEDPQDRQRAELIETAAQGAAELVRRLNRAAKGEEEDLQSVALSPRVLAALEGTQSLWQAEAEGRGITIDLVTKLEDVPPIRGTASEVDDILVNLIVNAVDALPEGGTITIGTEAMGDFVHLTVSDTGIGMDAETQRRVFEPLFTTKVDTGSGLGLYLVHTTVSNWGGDITVDSTLGKGTTFTLRLPFWQETQAVQGDDKEEASTMPLVKVLLVEDDEITVQTLVDYLSATCDVETITDGQTAVDAFTSGQYEVALIDLGIAGIPGDQVAQQMRQADPAIATVLITGFDLAEDDRRLAAFDLWYKKPLSVAQVDDMVEQAVSLHQSRMKGNS